jgi:hypothetical protein
MAGLRFRCGITGGHLPYKLPEFAKGRQSASCIAGTLFAGFERMSVLSQVIGVSAVCFAALDKASENFIHASTMFMIHAGGEDLAGSKSGAKEAP